MHAASMNDRCDKAGPVGRHDVQPNVGRDRLAWQNPME